jgi:hypothetical protein
VPIAPIIHRAAKLFFMFFSDSRFIKQGAKWQYFSQV